MTTNSKTTTKRIGSITLSLVKTEDVLYIRTEMRCPDGSTITDKMRCKGKDPAQVAIDMGCHYLTKMVGRWQG